MGVAPPVGKEDPASVEGESVIINREVVHLEGPTSRCYSCGDRGRVGGRESQT